MIPQPGDFAVISSHSQVGLLVDVMEFASDGFRPTQFSHACICSRYDKNGNVLIVEAMPGGAVEVPWHYEDVDHLWSTGLIEPTPLAGANALRYVGYGYGWADYASLAAHTLRLPFAPDLEARIARSHTMICSQLVDQAEQDSGIHLFNDGRPPGYVRPVDLADLLLSAGAQVEPRA
jgi:hypothetical protein